MSNLHPTIVALNQQLRNNPHPAVMPQNLCAFCVMSAELEFKNGLWQTGGKEDTLGRGLFGNFRIYATNCLDEVLPHHITLIVSGGLPRPSPGVQPPIRALVMAEELYRNGLRTDRPVLLQCDDDGSFDQLAKLMAQANRFGLKNIAIVVNEYFIPRLQAMMDHFTGITVIDSSQDDRSENPGSADRAKNFAYEQYRQFVDRGARFYFVAAEPIITAHDSELYYPQVKEMEVSPQYKKTKRMEVNGLADIQAGHYRARLTHKFT